MNHNLKASDNFKKFMFDLQEWIDAGLPDTPRFRKKDSLCFQVDNWGDADDISDALYAELQEWLPKGDPKPHYHLPFNSDKGIDEYNEELENEEVGHYANPARLKWIKDVVEHLKREEV